MKVERRSPPTIDASSMSWGPFPVYVAVYAIALGAVIIALAWHLRAGTAAARDSARDDVRGIRRGSLIALLGTLLLVGQCLRRLP